MILVRRLALGLVAGFTLAACSSSLSVNTDYNPGTDFSAYQTFSWMPERTLLVAQTTPVSPLLEGRLLRATRAELSSKGMRFVADAEQADVVVSFMLGARDKLHVQSYPATYRGNWAWGAPYYQNVDVRNYTEGTLSIDIFEVQRHQPVWHGWATKTITNRDRGSDQVINDIVKKILEEFPPLGL